jgi:glycosyltransferase involved in cell wall biosynthesis
MQDEQDTRMKFKDEILADELILFKHSYFENQRFVFQRLADAIGNEKGCVVTDNALTLNVLRQMGTSKSIVYLIHDFYYINVAQEYRHEIDACVVHSSFFKDVLLAADVEVFQDKSYYIPYGVELTGNDFVKPVPGNVLRLVFLGRWVKSKGILLLKEIDKQLQQRNIPVQWSILGSGPLEKELKAQWQNDKHAQFVTAKNTNEVYQVLTQQDVLIFPSRFEGTPVAIMEAMSRGVVPVVADLPGGTRDMVTDNVGFRCQQEKVEEFANAVEQLHNNRSLLQQMQQAGLQKIRITYDIKKAAGNYFEFFEKALSFPADHKGLQKKQFSKLDNPLIPSCLVYRIRKIKNG